MSNRSAGSGRRVVVNLVGDRDHGRLAESRFVERPFLPGGERTMYQLAFAAASLGYEVELRGWLDRTTFDRLAEATGTAPAVELAGRHPDSGDLVVVPEGWRDPLEYMRILLSPATPALFILAATGLFGWPFTETWTQPDPLTVDLHAVGRPEHLAAAANLGFGLITHSPGIVAVADAAGVECRFLGTGRPAWAPPGAVAKEIDVAILTENRWAPLAERVLAALPSDVSRDRIERVPNSEMLVRLARARVLIWPSRIEGHATIPWEARSVGCVPVALDTNRFAVGLDLDHGAELVSGVDEIAPAVVNLLADRGRLRMLSERGRATAPAEVDWDAFVQRVDGFLTSSRFSDPSSAARKGLGAALEEWVEGLRDGAHSVREELAVAKQDLTAATEGQIALTAELNAVRTDRDAWHDRTHQLQRELGELAGDRAVRAALAARKLLRRRTPSE